MSISYVNASTIVYSTGNPAATYPASLAMGDLLILLVGTKPDTAPVTRPIGDFAFLGAYSGGGGTTGVDTGPTRIGVFWKIATGAETGTQSVTVPGNSVTWVQMFHYSNATGFWDLAIAGGVDSTTGSSWSVTCDVSPGITAGDFVLVGSVIPTDVTTPNQFTSELVTATGATFAATTELSEPDSSSGNDIGGFVFHTDCTAGTSSAIPVITATASGTTTNVRGPSALIRIREASSQREIDPFTLNVDGAALEFADEVTDLGGGNGTGTWVYYNAFAENAQLLGSKISCTTSSSFTRIIRLPKELTDVWITLRFKFETAIPSNNIAILQVKTPAAVIQAEVQIRTNVLRMRNATTAVGSGVGPIALNNTYYVSWHLTDPTGQTLYLYDQDGVLIGTDSGTFNQGSFSAMYFGLLNAPGLATDLYISRPGYDTSGEILPTTVLSDIGFFGIPMA